MGYFKDQSVRSFSFTLHTPNDNIRDRCKIAGLSEKEANKLIDICNKLRTNENECPMHC